MMTRFNNLIFKTNEIDISSEKASRAFLIKVFHLYQRRNEWVNWDGDTSLVKRTWSLFDLSLQASTDSAERQRTQGTKFIIDEIPAICVVGDRHSLILTELFTESPLSHCELSGITHSVYFKDIQSKANIGRWFVSAIYTGKTEKLSSSDGDYYTRTSHSTGGKSYLAWSLKPRKMNLSKLQLCVNKINNN